MLENSNTLQWKAEQWFKMATIFERKNLLDEQLYCLEEGNRLLREAIQYLKDQTNNG